MLYRCRMCEHEEARGPLPTATCGLYVFGLVIVQLGCCTGLVHAIRRLAEARGAGADFAVPWWLGIIAVIGGLVLGLFGVVALHFLLAWSEYWLFVWRRPCPQCAEHAWTWGYTRGFGM